MSHFGNQDLYQGTFGINWCSFWNKSFFSNTSFTLSTSSYDEDFYETYTENYAIKNRTKENEFKLRNVNLKRINESISLEFGVDAKHLRHGYDNWLAAGTNASGDSIPELLLEKQINVSKAGAFLSVNFLPAARMSFAFGLRADYISYNQNLNYAPRISSRFRLTKKTSLKAVYGCYYQNLPLLFLVQNDYSKRLTDPKAIHYIMGLEHLLSADTRLTVEIYQKEYSGFPLDPTQPEKFIIDDNFFNYYEELTDTGRAMSRSIELIMQKKLAENIYGLASAACFRSRYKGFDGIWRDIEVMITD